MALYANYLTFDQPAGGATGIQTISGVGFEGKALLIVTLTHEEDETTGAKQLFAMTDGSAQSVRFIDHPGGEASGSVTSSQAERTDCMVYTNTATSGSTPTVRSRAEFGSWTDDGFTLDWTINTVEPGGVPRFHALVIGGPDIQVTVKQVKINVNTPSTINVTGVGFRPDSFIVMGGAADEFGTGDYNFGAPFGSIHGFGFSNASENICSWTLGRGNVGAADNYSGLHNTRCASVRVANTSGAGELCGISITSVTGDGFVVRRNAGTTLHQPIQHIMCLQGALFDLGTFDAPAEPGPVTVPLDFRAGLMIAQTHGSTTLNTTLNRMHLMTGAWVGTIGQGGTWIGGTDAANPSVYARASFDGYLIQTRDPVTLDVTCQASVTTATASGLTVNFNVTGGATFIYLALGSVIPQGGAAGLRQGARLGRYRGLN